MQTGGHNLKRIIRSPMPKGPFTRSKFVAKNGEVNTYRPTFARPKTHRPTFARQGKENRQLTDPDNLPTGLARETIDRP
jgi:hypothetical protein